jgi:serine/threonine-protein kinase
VLEVLGRGGMGVVYRVEHLRMGKIAAMKVLHRDLAGDPEVVQRFEREAAAVSRLHHPHSVQVFDFGTAQGALYLIMELIRGQDLGAIITRDGALPWSRAAPLFAQICGALQEAHELGVVHRDLKPENVLVTRTTGGRDYAKVLDFGLAQLDRRGDGSDLPSTTDRAQIVGTPYFMSPEQIRGDAVDERSDLYSFGALMFNVLTGEQLFTGTTAVGVLTKHLTVDPDAPSMRAPRLGLDPRIDHLVLRALAKDPAERWPTAAALADAIEEVFAETVGEITGATGSRSATRRQATTRLALVPDEATDQSDLRLRRSDLATFERGLRTRRGVALFGVVAVTLGLAGAAAWFLTREPPLVTEEREPNDELDHANRIAPGVAVTGYLGRRRSKTEGDRDVYQVRWPDGRGRRHVVTVTATGIPNLSLRLRLLSDTGTTLAIADDGGLGEGEALHRRAVDGALYVEVGQAGDGAALPIENVSDPYTLTVTAAPDDAGEASGPAWETEPNNTAADATGLVAGRELRGFLDARADVDLLRFDGVDGTYGVVVRADGLPLVWRTADDKPRSPGAADVVLHHGDLLRLERRERDAARGPLVGREATWSVMVNRRP